MEKTLTNRLHFSTQSLLRLGGALLVFLIFFAIAWGRLDADFGWHLVTGNYILSHGVPHHDIYTYTAHGHTWVDHEWGSDVILALLYRLGGYLLAAIFFSLIWTAALLLLGWRSRFWVLVLGAIAIAPYAGIRPIAWTVLLFALTLRIILSKNTKLRWLLIPLFLVWANLHGGFVAGLVLIAYFALVKRDKQLLYVLLLAIAVSFVNPFGDGLWREEAHTLFDSSIHSQIAEWRHFYIPTPSRPFILLWLIGFLLFAKPRWLRWLSLGPLLLVAGLDASRNIPLFVVASVKDLDHYVGLGIKKLPKPRKVQEKLVAGLVALMVLILFVYSLYVTFLPYQNRLASYPTAAVSYLKKHPCRGNLFNDYNYGGFLIWKLPNTPIYVDGRMITWTYYMNRYSALLNNPKSNYPSQFTQYNIQCVLVGDTTLNSKLIDTLINNNWHVELNKNDSVLLLKKS